MEFLSVRKDEGIAYVTLQNPREFNALSLKLLQELDSLLQEVAEKREVKVVVIEGSTKAFCAGHSLREIENMNVHEVLNLFQSLNIIELGKRMFYQQLHMEDFQALNYATEVIALNSKHPDAVEGIRAFFEKRTPVWNDNLKTRI
ncbi:enoyl-CoA hydratase-related protein [Thermolongibacillus altinsuensis]